MVLDDGMTNEQIFQQVERVMDYIERHIDTIDQKELNTYMRFICNAKNRYLLNDQKLFPPPK